MMKRIFFISTIVFLMLPVMAYSQAKSENPKGIHFPSALTQGYGQTGGLFNFLGLDPGKLKMRHSYSLSFMSFGGQGFSQGVYLNTLSYQFSTPLILSVQWGLQHQPLQTTGLGSPLQSGFFVSGANLEYKPSEKFQIGIQYSSYPAENYADYRRPFGYRPDFGKNSDEKDQ